VGCVTLLLLISLLYLRRRQLAKRNLELDETNSLAAKEPHMVDIAQLEGLSGTWWGTTPNVECWNPQFRRMSSPRSSSCLALSHQSWAVRPRASDWSTGRLLPLDPMTMPQVVAPMHYLYPTRQIMRHPLRHPPRSAGR
jgi:hypothetical protein